MPSSAAPSDRDLLDAVVDYLHRLAHGEFPERITTAEIPDDMKALVRTAALLGFQIESREKRARQSLRDARREVAHLRREAAALRGELARRPPPDEPSLPPAVHDGATRLARSHLDTLLVGGTDAERLAVARLIHRESDRAGRDLVVFGASDVAESIVETELFGSRGPRGKAIAPGVLARARGGTLYLANVERLGPSAQARLLRVLVSRDVLPVGATRAQGVDVRLVIGSARDMESLVEAARMREDLAGRLSDVQLVVGPPAQLEDSPADGGGAAAELSLDRARARAESAVIREALRRTGNNQNAAARLLGITPEGFRRKVKVFRRSTQ